MMLACFQLFSGVHLLFYCSPSRLDLELPEAPEEFEADRIEALFPPYFRLYVDHEAKRWIVWPRSGERHSMPWQPRSRAWRKWGLKEAVH